MNAVLDFIFLAIRFLVQDGARFMGKYATGNRVLVLISEDGKFTLLILFIAVTSVFPSKLWCERNH